MMITNNPLNEEDLVLLKKRARRRLVGAIVLVFFALIILWNVLDSVPPPSLVKPERIKITNEVPLVSSSSIQAPVLNQEEVANTLLVEPSAPEASRVEQLPAERLLPIASASSLPGTLISAPSTQSNKSITEKKSPQPKKVEKTTKPIVKEKIIPKDPMRILEGLDDPSASSKNAQPTKSALPTRTKYLLQVAAYKDAKKAEAVIQHLKMIGVRVSSEKVPSTKGDLTRVRVGPYAAREDAEAALKKMRVHGINATLVAK